MTCDIFLLGRTSTLPRAEMLDADGRFDVASPRLNAARHSAPLCVDDLGERRCADGVDVIPLVVPDDK